VQDRLTSLCVECGLRQPEGPACRRCRYLQLADLRTPGGAADAIRAFEQRTRTKHAKRLMRETPAARRAWWTFGLGGVGASSPVWIVALAMGTPAALAFAASSFAASAAIGAAWRQLSPMGLVGRPQQRELLEQADALVRATKREVLPWPSWPSPKFREVRGTLVGTEAASPFGTLALAERIVGELDGQPLDDAWVTGTEWTLRAPGAQDLEVDLEAGVHLDLTPEPADLEMRSPAARAYLAARGFSSLTQAPEALRTAALRTGAEVRITGVQRIEPRPDGYRGTKDVTVIGGPLRVSLST
jgi:hypothetical protein